MLLGVLAVAVAQFTGSVTSTASEMRATSGTSVQRMSPAISAPPAATGITYYVDGQDGVDTASGTSEGEAWRSLDRASLAPLKAGDWLLLRRGRVWNGTLDIRRNGEPDAPIVVGAYGSGPLPMITQGDPCIAVHASYVVVRHVAVESCTWSGVEIDGSGNTLELAQVSHNVAGVYIKRSASNNHILNNVIADNNRLSTATSGAFGVLLHGDNNEVADNTISGSAAPSVAFGTDGAAVEVYGGRGNVVHHNRALENKDFTELGDPRTSDNTFAYNVVTSSLPDAGFLTTRGADSEYGPVRRTIAEHNTVYLTGARSQGFVCHGGCELDLLRLRDNVIHAVWKVGYTDGPVDDGYGLYSGGDLQFTIGPETIVADPRFMDIGSGDFRLARNSPGIDSAATPAISGYDIDGTAIPQDGDGDGVNHADRGAYETDAVPGSTSPAAAGVAPTEPPVPISRSGAVVTSPPGPSGAVAAVVGSDPVGSPGDAADDPAIWAHPVDQALSLVLGTERTSRGGLHVYDLDGKERQFIQIGNVNNVDVRYGFILSTGEVVDLVTATDMGRQKILIYRVDVAARMLVDIRASTVPALPGAYGYCMYHSAGSGRFYGFASSVSTGTWRQVEFAEHPQEHGRITYAVVRTIRHPLDTASRAGTEKMEGCVVDDRSASLYVSEELYGIHVYDAEPHGGNRSITFATVQAGELGPDVEGLAIYPNGADGGYLIASDQGDNEYSVFELPRGRYLGRFMIESGVVDGVSHTDGITAASGYFDARYQTGLFVAQDDSNAGGKQNFKLVAWESIASHLGLR